MTHILNYFVLSTVQSLNYPGPTRTKNFRGSLKVSIPVIASTVVHDRMEEMLDSTSSQHDDNWHNSSECQQSPFLRLPPEIRLKIYSFVIGQPSIQLYLSAPLLAKSHLPRFHGFEEKAD